MMSIHFSKEYLIRIFVAIITLSATINAYSKSPKLEKIAKQIYFDGQLENKMPVGHGTLMLDTYMQLISSKETIYYTITGDFSDGTINNATLKIPQTHGMPTEELDLYAVKTVSGNMKYSIDRDNSILTIDCSDVKLEGKYPANLGIIEFGNKLNGKKFSGMRCLTTRIVSEGVIMPDDETWNDLEPLMNITNTDLQGRLFKVEIGGDADFGKFSTRNDIDIMFLVLKKYRREYYFDDGSKLVLRDKKFHVGNGLSNTEYFSCDGDHLYINAWNYNTECLGENSVIKLQDGSTMTLNGELLSPGIKASIKYSDGASYTGTLVLPTIKVDKLPSPKWDGFYTYFKHVDPATFIFQDGTYVNSKGESSEYSKGVCMTGVDIDRVTEQVQNLTDINNINKAVVHWIDIHGDLAFSNASVDYRDNANQIWHTQFDSFISDFPKIKHANEDIFYATVDISELQEAKFDKSTKKINILRTNRLYKEAQENEKNLYFNLYDGVFCSIPKSLIIKESRNNLFDQKVDVLNVGLKAYGMEIPNGDVNSSYKLCFFFNKPHVKYIYDQGRLFGETLALYLVNSDGKVICNLTNNLSADNTKIKGTKNYYKPSTKTYHKVGYVQECAMCLGTGTGLVGGACPFCGAKGWYIEHYW